MTRKKRTKRPRGPKPDSLALNTSWSTAVQRALAKKRPKRGWPKHNKSRRK